MILSHSEYNAGPAIPSSNVSLLYTASSPDRDFISKYGICEPHQGGSERAGRH